MVSDERVYDIYMSLIIGNRDNHMNLLESLTEEEKRLFQSYDEIIPTWRRRSELALARGAILVMVAIVSDVYLFVYDLCTPIIDLLCAISLLFGLSMAIGWGAYCYSQETDNLMIIHHAIDRHRSITFEGYGTPIPY